MLINIKQSYICPWDYYRGLSILTLNSYSPSKFGTCHVCNCHNPLVSHIETTFRHMWRWNREPSMVYNSPHVKNIYLCIYVSMYLSMFNIGNKKDKTTLTWQLWDVDNHHHCLVTTSGWIIWSTSIPSNSEIDVVHPTYGPHLLGVHNNWNKWCSYKELCLE